MKSESVPSRLGELGVWGLGRHGAGAWRSLRGDSGLVSERGRVHSGPAMEEAQKAGEPWGDANLELLSTVQQKPS